MTKPTIEANLQPSMIFHDNIRKLPRLYDNFSGSQKVTFVCKRISCPKTSERFVNEPHRFGVSYLKKPGANPEKQKVAEQFRQKMCLALDVPKLRNERARIRNWHFHPSLLCPSAYCPYSYITDVSLAQIIYEDKADTYKVDGIENCWFVLPSLLDAQEPNAIAPNFIQETVTKTNTARV